MRVVQTSPAHRSARRLTTLLAAALAVSCAGEEAELFDPTTSLYALVTTVDGVAFYPPLGPELGAPVNAFDPTLLDQLRVVLETTDAAGRVASLATFDAHSTPALVLAAPFEVYWVNVPAAAYFRDPSLAYRFRVLLGDAELGRSDLSSHVFVVLEHVPSLSIGVKVRVEARPAPALSALTPASIAAGSPDLTLTLDGARFTHDSAVSFGGHALTPTFVSASRLTAVVPASLLAATGRSDVTVSVPAPGGGTTSALSFETVLDTGNIVRGGLALHFDAALAASAPAGSRTWFDLSGFGRNGALTAGAVFDTAHGGSVRFDGTDDYVVVPNGFSATARNATAWTFSVWLSVRQFSPPYPVIFSIGSTPASNYYELFLETSASTTWLASGGVLQSTNISTALNTVYNYTWVLSGSTAYLYRNGVRLATYGGMPRGSDVAGDLFIGRFKNAGYELAGNIYQLQVYTRALTAAEIAQNYDALRGRFGL